jgi:hypothetical protein
MKTWAGYFLLAFGAVCLISAWYGRLPDTMEVQFQFPPKLAVFMGLAAIITGLGVVIVGRCKNSK